MTSLDPAELARRARISALEMCSRSGASHIGAALSVIDILATVYAGAADVAPDRVDDSDRAIVLVSKGHSASGVYAVLAHAGYFPLDWLDDYYLDGSHLGGHVTAHGIPGVEGGFNWSSQHPRVSEVASDGDGGLVQEDQRCSRGCAPAVACGSGVTAAYALAGAA